MTRWKRRQEIVINWKTTMNKNPSTTTKTWKNREKIFYEDTVIGYLYVNDSSRSPRLSHSVNCLTAHLAANSWLNLNILWLKWMHQRLRHRKVTRFSLSSTSRCTSIPLMLTLTYPLGLWYISDFSSHPNSMNLLNPSLAMYQWQYSFGCETVYNFLLLWT